MIWKDRLEQYPHRYTLTNVSGSTYDFTKVTGEVTEAGTPVNAENLNKLIQRDGDDIKDTVTTFTEASTRANIATGESTATLFGKIKKYFTDLKAHAFANPSTAQGTGTTTVPSNQLLTNSSFAATYRSLTDSRLLAEGITASSNPAEVVAAMVAGSILIADTNGYTNLTPTFTGGTTQGTIFIIKPSAFRSLIEWSWNPFNGVSEYTYRSWWRSDSGFSGWKREFTHDNISTVMPISSAAASNEKVLGEKVVYDEVNNRAFNALYFSLADSRLGVTPSTVTPEQLATAMANNSFLHAGITSTGNPNLYPSGLGITNLGNITVKKIDGATVEFTFSVKQTNGVSYAICYGTYRSGDTSNKWSGWQRIATTNNPTFTGTVTVPTTPSGPSAAVAKSYVDGLSTPYSKVIRTQPEFDALIADPDWLGATSVALVGQFTYSDANNSGIKIPSTVKQIHGFNGAKITVTNFLYNSSTAKGGLWYDELPTTLDYSIRDLEVDCTGTNAIGFYNCTNLTNCTGTGTGVTEGYGFYDCTNLTNCTGTGTGTAGYGFGFCTNLTNCTGTGTGTGTIGYGFGFCTNLTNCTGTGTGTGTAGYGFRNCTNLTNCTGTGTGTGTAGYGFYNIDYASNCRDGGSSTDMWGGTNKNIDVDTCCKTLVTANNTTLNT